MSLCIFTHARSSRLCAKARDVSKRHFALKLEVSTTAVHALPALAPSRTNFHESTRPNPSKSEIELKH